MAFWHWLRGKGRPRPSGQQAHPEAAKLELEASHCPDCMDGARGILGVSSKVQRLVKIETEMKCGCGGNVSHVVFQCPSCCRFYLYALEDHWPPSSADEYFFEIDQAEAKATVDRLKQCPNLDDDDCPCQVHRESEFLHVHTRGTLRFSEATEQSWS